MNQIIALCVVWANPAYEKMLLQKPIFKRKAQEPYMIGEDAEMAALMPDHYAGKYKKSYDPAPWSNKN